MADAYKLSGPRWQNRIVGYDNVAPDQLLANPHNFRRHPKTQQDVLAGVLSEIGWLQDIIVNRVSGCVIDGHLRVELALRKGEPTVPVKYVELAEDEERLALATFDPLAAMAQADAAALDALLSSVNSGDAAVQAMLAELAQEAGLYPPKETVDAEPQVDRAEELRQKWGVESGDLWQLGEHRLICGDCTDSAVVARVMEGGGCPTLVYDPEWDAMPPPPAYESALVFGDGQRAADAIRLFGAPAWVFGWDCVSCWYTPNRPLRRMKLCLWYGAMDSYRFDGWHYGDAGDAREVFNTRGSYQFKPDPRGKHLADLFSAPITRLHAESEHNHSKPLDWITLLIANCTQGDVFDPFSGSGTTIIACEQLGRKCRAIEISEGYTAVALERFFQATGKTSVRVG